MSLSKRSMGVEGFIQTPRPFPTQSELTDWAPKEMRYGRMLAKFDRVDLDEEKLSIVYKLGNDKEVSKKINSRAVDEAIDQKVAFLRLVSEAFN